MNNPSIKNPFAASLRKLYVSQFLSAFADNAIFFIILGILKDTGVQNPESSMSIPQALFLVAYVVLAPFVGTFAEKWPKSKVLLIGNLVKVTGVGLLFLGIEPALCYMVLGVGAVMYSPAKYGILMELTSDSKTLLAANGRLEGLTIVAILTGTVSGGFIAAGMPVSYQLLICAGLYAISVAIAFTIPNGPQNPDLQYVKSAREFTADLGKLLRHPVTRFTLIGGGGFWMIASLMRIAFLAWLTLNLPNIPESQRPTIVGMTAIGIVIGALLAPKLFEVRTFYKSAYVGLLLVGTVSITVFAPNLYVLVPLLLAIGAFGGLYVVPMNAALQETGTPMIGSGKVIAIQNFVENVMMCGSMGLLFLYNQKILKTRIETVMLIGAGALLLIVIYLLTQLKTVRSYEAETTGEVLDSKGKQRA